MLQRVIAATALVCFVVAGSAVAQVNSSIGGTVQDASQALIPGVTITALNTQTGVQTQTLSNESGAYNFAALIPGVYKVTAELAGFRPHTFNDVQLSPGLPLRLNGRRTAAPASNASAYSERGGSTRAATWSRSRHQTVPAARFFFRPAARRSGTPIGKRSIPLDSSTRRSFRRCRTRIISAQ